MPVDEPANPATLRLRVAAFSEGYQVVEQLEAVQNVTEARRGAALRILRADGTAVWEDVPGNDEAAARLVVSRLEHLARWDQLRTMGDHPSRLNGAVTLDLWKAGDGENADPADRLQLPPGDSYELQYRLDATSCSWTAPSVFIDLHNRSDEDLFVALLDLTERYRCDPILPTQLLPAGSSVSMWDGSSVPVSLPAGRAVTPGARGRDWLKVLASDVAFDANSFELPALDHADPPRPTARTAPDPGQARRPRLVRATSHARPRMHPSEHGPRPRQSSQSSCRPTERGPDGQPLNATVTMSRSDIDRDGSVPASRGGKVG